MANFGELLKGALGKATSGLGKGLMVFMRSSGGFFSGMLSPFARASMSMPGAAGAGFAFSAGEAVGKGVFGSIARFFRWLFRTIFPDNIFGATLFYYFIIQWLLFDIIVFKGNYAHPFVIASYKLSSVFFVFLLTITHRDDEEGGLLFYLGKGLTYGLMFLFIWLATFKWIPILLGIIEGGIGHISGKEAMNSLYYITTRFSSSLPVFPIFPVFGTFLLVFFWNKTRLARSYLGWMIVLLLLLNLSSLVAYFKTTTSSLTSSGYSLPQTQKINSLWGKLKHNVVYLWDGFHKLLNGSWVDELTKSYTSEKIEGQYNEEANQVGVVISATPTVGRIVSYDEGKNLGSTILVTLSFTKPPTQECFVQHQCGITGKVNVSCSVDSPGVYLVDGKDREDVIEMSTLYDASSLLLAPIVHTCKLKVSDKAQPGKINVEIKAVYNYIAASNFDLPFADEDLITSCIAENSAPRVCLGYGNLKRVSESSSGPVLLSLGLPSSLQMDVVPVRGNSGISQLPLLISLSNKFKGKLERINALYLAFPEGLTPENGGLCHLASSDEVNCESIFGKGLFGYTCYKLDSDFLNKPNIMNMLMQYSITCLLDVNEDTVLNGGEKAVKNIKAFLNYSYSVVSNVSLLYVKEGGFSDASSYLNKCECKRGILFSSFCDKDKAPLCDGDSCSCVSKDEVSAEKDPYYNVYCGCKEGKVSEDNCGDNYTAVCKANNICGCIKK